MDYSIKLDPAERSRLLKLIRRDDCPTGLVRMRTGMILNLGDGRSDLIEKRWFAEPGELAEAARIYCEGAVDGLLSAK